MKILISIITLVILNITPCYSMAQDYRLSKIGMYYITEEEGERNIEPGTYVITAFQNNHFATTVTVGDNLNKVGEPINDKGNCVSFTLVHPWAKKIDKTGTYESYTIKLEEGQMLYLYPDDVQLTRTDLQSDEASEYNQSSGNEKEDSGLTDDERKKIYNSAPYVSSKNVVVDSPDGIDFYTYLGSGIIMSGSSGDCFKMIECDDEPIIEHYKIIPVKEGKGTITYEINFKKTINVNVTVKKSALMPIEEYNAMMEQAGENAKKATVTKSVNIRSDATSESTKVGSAKEGETLIVTQEYYTEKWHQILYNGELCYVSANYVKIQ